MLLKFFFYFLWWNSTSRYFFRIYFVNSSVLVVCWLFYIVSLLWFNLVLIGIYINNLGFFYCDLYMLTILFIFYFDKITPLGIYLGIILWIPLLCLFMIFCMFFIIISLCACLWALLNVDSHCRYIIYII